MKSDERLQIWIEQGNVTIPQLFFQHYKSLGLKDIDAMLVMHMNAYQSEGNSFPTPSDFTSRMDLTENQVSQIFQRLMQHGFLKIGQNEDSDGVLYETFSLLPLWERVIDQVTSISEEEISQEQENAEGEIFKLFEQEFGRLLSPMECETITMWLDVDSHSTDIIRAALKEAVIAQKLSLRYIDRILFEWKKKNVKTMSDVEKQTKSFRTIGVKTGTQLDTNPVKRVPFYNWLEERE